MPKDYQVMAIQRGPGKVEELNREDCLAFVKADL